MNITAKSPASQAKTMAYLVTHKLSWKGVRHVPGDTIDVTADETDRADVSAWLDHGWIKDPREDKPVAAVPAKTAVGKAAKPKAGPGGSFDPAVPCVRVRPSPWNPRKDFSSPGAVEYLAGIAQSVREQGIIEPLIVRRITGTGDQLADGQAWTRETCFYEIVAGECRWRAAKLAGLDVVPCLIRDLDKKAAIMIQAVENLQRRDINAMEESDGYELLMREGGLSVPDIARETGKSEATIYARLKLRECPPGIRTALVAGRIPASTAELVARIEDSDLRFAFMDAILFPPASDPGDEPGGVLSFRQAKRWLEANRARLEREADWKKRSKESHGVKTAAAVLSVEESDRVLMSGGYVKNSQLYVKPTDVCPADPKQRTFEAIAKEAGRELPAPVVARDPAGGAPVTLLPRGDAEKALADLVPDAAEQERRRQEADARRKEEIRVADEKRRAHSVDVANRAKAAVVAVGTLPWSETVEERLLRFAVRSRIDALADVENFVEMLTARGCPITKGEDVVTGEWTTEYLDGCNLAQLRGWLVEFGFRDEYGFYVDEARLTAAEEIIEEFAEPQTSAVAI